MIDEVFIRSLRRVNNTSGMTAKGRPKLRTTWLITSVRVGFQTDEDHYQRRQHGYPSPEPQRDVTLQKALHDHLAGHGPHRRGESPEASKEMAKTQVAAEPSRGSSVMWASSMLPMSPTRALKSRGRHDQHRHIDETCHTHCHDNVHQFETEQPPAHLRVVDDDAVLSQ